MVGSGLRTGFQHPARHGVDEERRIRRPRLPPAGAAPWHVPLALYTCARNSRCTASTPLMAPLSVLTVLTIRRSGAHPAPLTSGQVLGQGTRRSGPYNARDWMVACHEIQRQNYSY